MLNTNPNHLRSVLQYFLIRNWIDDHLMIVLNFEEFSGDIRAVLQQLARDGVVEFIRVGDIDTPVWRLKASHEELEKLLLLL